MVHKSESLIHLSTFVHQWKQLFMYYYAWERLYFYGGTNDKSLASRSLDHLFSSEVLFVLGRLSSEEDLERQKRLDGNVCSCPGYIVTIDPPKHTDKYITDHEAVHGPT